MPQKTPKMDPMGPEPPKNEGIFQVKLRTAYRQTLKLGMDKRWKNADAIDYVRISVDRLARPQGPIYAHFGLPLPSNFFFNFGYILPLEPKWKLLKYSSTITFLCLKNTSGENFSKIKHIWGIKGKKTPKKGHFMDAESVRKTLKIYNLTTKNAILIKLTRILYLHKVSLQTLKA